MDYKTLVAQSAQVGRSAQGSRTGARFSNVTTQKIGEGLVEVTFDLAWDDSWRCPEGLEPHNWDAVWVFFRYYYNPGSFVQIPITRDRVDRVAVGQASEVVAELVASPEGAPLVAQFPALKKAKTFALPGARKGEWILGFQRPGSPRKEYIDLVVAGDPAKLTLSCLSAWQPAGLAASPGQARDDVVIEETDGTGLFVYRKQPTEHGARGGASFSGLKVQCSLDQMPRGFTGKIGLWPLALEMVYVPEARFYLGDPKPEGGPTNCFYDPVRVAKGLHDASFLVDSEGEIIVGTPAQHPEVAKLLFYDNDDDVGGAGDQRGPLPQAFPKGFAAFYVMKRQITQGEYADFLNTLQGDDYAQMVRYPYTGEGAFRGTLAIANLDTFARVATRPMRPCNHLSWADGIAFAAWAGLRPMTELEYEKACRGPGYAHHAELAWGQNAQSVVNALAIIGSEAGDHYATGNCNVDSASLAWTGGDGGFGPVEDDAFTIMGDQRSGGLFGAVSVIDTVPDEGRAALWCEYRFTTGVSYYGIAALSGNLWELCVSAGNEDGRAFTGDHGRCVLHSPGGQAPTRDVLQKDAWRNAEDAAAREAPSGLSWPGPASSGYAFRGGSWYAGVSRAFVASRGFGAGAPGYYYRTHDTGFRCARTAPKRG